MTFLLLDQMCECPTKHHTGRFYLGKEQCMCLGLIVPEHAVMRARAVQAESERETFLLGRERTRGGLHPNGDSKTFHRRSKA